LVMLLIPFAIGILRILEQTNFIHFRIDLVLFRDHIEVNNSDYGPGRMATSSAVCFLLLAVALANLYVRNGVNQKLSHYLVLLVFLLGLYKCIGYLYRVSELFNLLMYDPMSIRTAVNMVLLSTAIILYHPAGSFFSVLASSGTGGVIARILVPLAVAIPVFSGYLRLWFQWQHPVKIELGTSLLIMSIVMTFLAMILYASHVIRKKDILQRIAETKFQRLVESAPDALVIVDAAGIIKIVNAQTEKIFGYMRAELLGHKIEKLIPAHAHKTHSLYRTQFFQHPKSRSMGIGLELYGVKKDASLFPVEISLSPLETEDGLLVSAAVRDTTERRQLDEKVRFLAIIAENIHDPVIAYDNDFLITRWTPAAEKLLEWTNEEAIGKAAMEVLKVIYPNQSREQILADLAQNGFWNGELIYHTKSGRAVDVFTTASRLQDRNGGIIGTVIIIRDITLMKRSEEALRELNAQLETRVERRTADLSDAYETIAELNARLEQKIAARTKELELSNKEMEAFSYSVAHDLRTPLRAVAGYSTMLQEDYHDQFDAEGKRLLAALQYNNRKMGNLIDDLLAFSRLSKKAINKSLLDMESLVTSVLSDMAPTAAVVRIGKLHPIVADAVLIKQVMINLISNAVKYSSKSTNATIDIFSDVNEAGVNYSVKDNGVGFDMKYAAKLFGVFQRLHSEEEFEGTGVGLAIVRRIIDRHGGEVSVDAEIGHGATFSFSIPHLDNDKFHSNKPSHHESK
jgi:PAS domain S-box-containing protein